MTPTKLEAATAEYKARKVASKARSKVKAGEWKEAKRVKDAKVKPGYFDYKKYKCWLTGNGQKGQG